MGARIFTVSSLLHGHERTAENNSDVMEGRKKLPGVVMEIADTCGAPRLSTVE